MEPSSKIKRLLEEYFAEQRAKMFALESPEAVKHTTIPEESIITSPIYKVTAS